MTPALHLFVAATVAVFGSPQAVAQVESCLDRARDMTALEACTEQEIRPLEEQFVRRTKSLLSKYPDTEADSWERILVARESWRQNSCTIEGQLHALRSNSHSKLEKRRGFALCQKRILQSILQALADCERTSSLCERAMTMEAAGVKREPIQGTVLQLNEKQKALIAQSRAASAQARISYCSGSALQAVADLERSIPLIDGEVAIWSSILDVGTAFNYPLVLNHGRLAKLHGALGNHAQSERHKNIAHSLPIVERYVADPLALVSDTDEEYCEGTK